MGIPLDGAAGSTAAIFDIQEKERTDTRNACLDSQNARCEAPVRIGPRIREQHAMRFVICHAGSPRRRPATSFLLS